MLGEILFSIFVTGTRATEIQTSIRIWAIIEKGIDICNESIVFLKIEQVDFSAEVFV